MTQRFSEVEGQQQLECSWDVAGLLFWKMSPEWKLKKAAGFWDLFWADQCHQVGLLPQERDVGVSWGQEAVDPSKCHTILLGAILQAERKW